MEDIAALKAGVLDGTIAAVATDHAPHPGHAKEMPLDQAPPGMLGLETALGVLNTSLDIDARRIAELLSWNPARIAGVEDRHGRPVAVGEPANLAVWSKDVVWTVSRDELASKSSNTPYHGMELRGKNRHTLHDGNVVVKEGKALR